MLACFSFLGCCRLRSFLLLEFQLSLSEFFTKGFLGIIHDIALICFWIPPTASSSAYSTISFLPVSSSDPITSLSHLTVALSPNLYWKMLGEFITRILLMILGYAYPALQCYKTIERRNKVDNAQLRFWCEYWIIIAMLTVLERFGDLFVSWLPMYSEAKLAFVIYLWYPKTKGTSYVYETLLRPFVSEHETDIDQKLHSLRARVWDLAIFYWQNCTEVGQSKLFEVLGHLFSQPSKATDKKNALIELQGDSSKQRPKPSAPPLPPPNTFATFFSRSHKRRQSIAKTWTPPSPESVTSY